MNIPDLVAQARSDLYDIRENLRWAHADGYNATNATNARSPHEAPRALDLEDRATGEPVHFVVPEHPDHVRGARHDIGIGDHRSRSAYRQSVIRLRRAEGFLVLACHGIGVAQPDVTRPTPSAPLELLELNIVFSIIRLGIIDAGWPANPRAAQRHTANAAREIDRAWHQLNHAFERGPIDPASHAFGDACRICAIRPTVPKAGGRCNTCHAWRTRKGYERPTTLDSVHEARAAKQRRIRRGDGWGDESLSATGSDR